MQAKMVSDTLLRELLRRGKPAALMHHAGQGSPSKVVMKKASLRWLFGVIG